jgi:predicted PurR-regulated permease PerM
VTLENEREPPLTRWWVTRVLVAAGAVVAVLIALRLVVEAIAPLSHVILLVLFGVIVASILAPLVHVLQRYVRRRAIAVTLAALATMVIVVVTSPTLGPLLDLIWLKLQILLGLK